MKIQIRLLPNLLLLFFCAAVNFGQTSAETNSSTSSFPGLKNKPYSAESIRETTRTLADGNTITETVKSLEYRDSEGRTRREEVSQIPARPYSLNVINIFDPVGGYGYSLFPANKEVFRTKLSSARPSISIQTPSGRTSTREPLGNRTIEGIDATGMRILTITAPGVIGNEKEIRQVSERWFSDELRLPLLTISDDPRFGKSTTRLINIKRDEPDKSLFEIPADYKIIDREPLRLPTASPTPAKNSDENKKP